MSEKNNWKIEVKETGPASREIAMTAAPELVDNHVNNAIDEVRRDFVIPGFRKGKAPRQLVERKLGDRLYDDIRQKLVSEGWQKAIEDHKLNPIGEPRLPQKADPLPPTPSKGNPFSITLEVEISPEFDLPNFSTIKLERPVIEVDEKMIQDEIKRLGSRHGESNDISENFKPLDRIIGNARAQTEEDEKPFFDEQNVAFISPEKKEGQILGLIVDDLAERVKTLKIGDIIEFEQKIGDNHEIESIRGKKVSVHFKVTNGQRITPRSQKELTTLFGLDDENILKDQIKFSLNQRKDQEIASILRNQALETIADQLSFDLPERASALQVERDLERIRIDLASRGSSDEDIEKKLTEVRSESSSASQKRLKQFFIMQKLVSDLNIDVTEQEINHKIAHISAQHGMSPPELKDKLIKENRLDSLAMQVRDEKAADLMVTKCNISDISLEEWKKSQDKES